MPHESCSFVIDRSSVQVRSPAPLKYLPQLQARDGGVLRPARCGTGAPAIDMMDRKEKIVLRADLPELEQKDVEVSVENNTRTVRGERKAEKKTKDEDYYACERRTGAFFRSVTLPPGVDARRCAPRSGTGCWRCTSRRRTRHGPRRS